MVVRSAVRMLLAFLAPQGTAAIRTSMDEQEFKLELSTEALNELQAGMSLAGSEEAWAKAMEEMTPEQQQAMEQLKEALKKAPEAEKHLTCDKLQEEMPKMIVRLTDELHPSCAVGSCDFSSISIEEVVTGQQLVTTLAAEADKKKCLAETMGTQVVQDKLEAFLSIVPKVLESAGSADGNARLQEAYLQLVSFQDGVPDLAKEMADRQLLHRIDINFEKECPKPCQMCKKSGAFGFECMLYKKDKDSNPDLSGRKVECVTPNRRSFSWFRKYKFTKKCTVPDLEESAVQHMHVGAVASCTVETILMSLNGHLTAEQRAGLYDTCLAVEQGNSVAEDKQATYENQAKVMDGTIPRQVSLAMNSILSVGLASGLAGLRAATRGNDLPVLLEGGALDYKAPYAKYLGDMTIRAEDRARYADRQHVRRWETLQRLGACEGVYSLEEQHTFLEGVKPLSMHSMGIAHEVMTENQQEEVGAGALAQSGQSGGAPSPPDFTHLPPAPLPGQGSQPAPPQAPATTTPRPKWAGGTFKGFAMTALISGIVSILFSMVWFYLWVVIIWYGTILTGSAIFMWGAFGAAWLLWPVGIFYIVRELGFMVGRSLSSSRSAQQIEKCIRSASTSPLSAP